MADYPPFVPLQPGNALIPLQVRGRRSARVQAMLTNPASAPVFTLDGPLAGGVLTPSNPGVDPFRYENAGSLFQNGAYWSSNTGGAAAGNASTLRVAFDFDGQKFSVALFGAGSVVRVWANEQPSPFFTTLPADSAAHTLLVDFGTRAYRRIVVELVPFYPALNSPAYFGGILKVPADTLWPPSLPNGFKLAFVGDSYAFGMGATQVAQGFAHTLARALGTTNTAAAALSGTGFVASAFPYSWAPRLAELIAATPDIVLANVSLNDSVANQGGTGTLGPAIAKWVAAINAGLPNAQIVLVGLLKMQTANAQDLLCNTDCKNAAASAGLPFIDPETGPGGAWFSGTGTVTVPTGDGNADFYASSAYPNHPTPAGHDALGNRMAREVSGALGLDL